MGIQTVSHGYEILSLPNDNSYRILKISPEELMTGVTGFSLGSVGYTADLEEYGLVLAMKAKALNAQGAVVGIARTNQDVVSLDFRLFSISPFLVAEALKSIAWGLLSGGIFPFVDLEDGYEVEILKALASRNVFPGILTTPETVEKDNTLKTLLSDRDWFLAGETTAPILNWEYVLSEIRVEEIRRTLLLKAIVLIRKPSHVGEIQILSDSNDTVRTGIAYIVVKDPRFIPAKNAQGVVFIPYLQDFIVSEAEEILNGLEIARGKKNW